MKKVFSLLLILAMCLSMLTSCFGSEWREQQNGGADEALTAAADFLYNIMKDKEGAENVYDFDVVAKLVISGVTYDVTWETDNANVKIVKSSKDSYWTVDIPTTNDKAFSYKLTATIKNADGESIQKEFNRKVPVISGDNALIVGEPVEGVEYKLFIVQYTARKVLFLKNATQNNDNKYILTTDKPADGAIYKVEKVDGGYKFYTEVDGAKNYILAKIEVKVEDGKEKTSKYLGFSTEDASVFYYKQNVGAWFTMIDNAEFVMGTYQSYETASLSEGKFMTESAVANKEQFAVSIMTKASSDTYVAPEFESSKEPADGSTLTIKEAVELGNTYNKGAYTSGKFVLTGTITEIQSAVYGNVIISDGTDSILVYGMYTANSVRFDKMDPQPKVGDEITVKGVIGKYNDAQMKDGTLLKLNGKDVAGGSQGGTTEGESLKLDLMGTATRTEYSTSKTVHSANGVTYTNEKGSSTTNNYDQTAAYEARAYKSSIITISADKAFKKIVFSMSDYVTSDGKNYYSGFDGMTVAGATITRDGTTVTVVLDEAKTSFTFAPLLAQVRIASVTVSATAGESGGNQGGTTEGESFVLDLMGTATRTEYSTSKTVHSANGVTYTNEKGSSTTNNYDQTAAYEARAYKSSIITISADKAFKKIVFSMSDYVTSDGKNYYSGFDGMTVAGATITRDGTTVTVILDEAQTSFTFAELLAQVRIANVTVSTEAGESGGNQGGNEGGETTEAFTLVTAPAVGTAYYFRINQNSLQKLLYFVGATESETVTYRLASTEDDTAAVLVYLEAVEGVEGGYYLYFMNEGVKTYIRVWERTPDEKKGSLELVTSAPAEYFTFDSTYNTLIHTAETGEKYYLGTYSSYVTFSVSNISFASTSFVSGLYVKNEIGGEGSGEGSGEGGNEGGETPTPPHEHAYTEAVVDPTCIADGYTEHKCECGDSYKDTYVDAIGHKDENEDKICDGCGIDMEHYNVVAAPSVGVPYFFGLAQGKLGYNLFFNGKTADKDYYLATEKSAEKADLRVFLEEVEGVAGAYRIYFETLEAGKVYIRVYERDAENKKGSLALVTEIPEEYFVYDVALQTMVHVAETGEKYYIGTYNNFETFSVSNVSFASTSFVSHFYMPTHIGHPAYEAGKVVEPTCTEKGYTVYVCICGDTYLSDFVDMVEHVDQNDDKFCDECGQDVRIYNVLIGNPVVGEAYYLGLNQQALGQVIYFNGKTANQAYYLATDLLPLDCVKVYLEEFNELGRRLYFYDAEGVKTYIRIYERDAEGKKGSLELTTLMPVEYLVFDESLNTLVYRAPSGNVYYLGTFGTYNTLSVSHADYAAKDGNYVVRLYTISAVPHEHVYTSENVVAPTCTAKGYTEHFCPCGHSMKDTYVDEIAHNYVDTVVAPTCSEEGYTYHECEDCGDHYTDTPVGVVDHVDADGNFRCDFDGCTVKFVPEANSVLTIEQAIMLGELYAHNTFTPGKYYVTGTIKSIANATYGNMYLTDGENSLYVYGVYAIDGGDKYGEFAVKPAVGDEITVWGVIGYYSTQAQLKSGWIQHDYEAVVTEPGCTTDGYTTHTCKWCGDSYTDTEVEANGHNYVDGVCDVCGIPDHQHNYVPDVKAPTCTEPGYTTYTCSCGDSYVDDEKDASGHKDEENKGYCSVCEELFIGEINMMGDTTRTEYSTSELKHEANGVVVINSKTNESSDCYKNTNSSYAARFYKSSIFTVQYKYAMSKIVLTLDDMDNGKYLDGLDNVNLDGAFVVRDGSVVTIYLVTPTTTFTSSALAAQIRVKSIAVYPSDPDHTHAFVETTTATCKDNGHAIYTCACGLSGIGSTMAATGEHVDDDGDSLCDVCEANMGSVTTYQKIDAIDQLTDGTYVLITAKGYAPTVYDSSKWVLAVQPVVQNGTLVDPRNAFITITVKDGKASLQDSNGKYLAPSGGNTNGIKTSTTAYMWAVSVEGGKFIFAGTGSDTVMLGSNHSSSYKFRAYKNSTLTGSSSSGYTYKFDVYKVVES